MIDLETFRRIKALKKDGYVQRSVAADVGVNIKTVQRWWNRSEDEFLGNGRTNRDDRLNVYKDFLVGELSRESNITDTVLREYYKLSIIPLILIARSSVFNDISCDATSSPMMSDKSKLSIALGLFNSSSRYGLGFIYLEPFLPYIRVVSQISSPCMV